MKKIPDTPLLEFLIFQKPKRHSTQYFDAAYKQAAFQQSYYARTTVLMKRAHDRKYFYTILL